MPAIEEFMLREIVSFDCILRWELTLVFDACRMLARRLEKSSR